MSWPAELIISGDSAARIDDEVMLTEWALSCAAELTISGKYAAAAGKIEMARRRLNHSRADGSFFTCAEDAKCT